MSTERKESTEERIRVEINPIGETKVFTTVIKKTENRFHSFTANDAIKRKEDEILFEGMIGNINIGIAVAGILGGATLIAEGFSNYNLEKVIIGASSIGVAGYYAIPKAMEHYSQAFLKRRERNKIISENKTLQTEKRNALVKK
jgi:hypothetical protein